MAGVWWLEGDAFHRGRNGHANRQGLDVHARRRGSHHRHDRPVSGSARRTAPARSPVQPGRHRTRRAAPADLVRPSAETARNLSQQWRERSAVRALGPRRLSTASAAAAKRWADTPPAPNTQFWLAKIEATNCHLAAHNGGDARTFTEVSSTLRDHGAGSPITPSHCLRTAASAACND